MAKVYFKRVENKDYAVLSAAARTLLERLCAEEGHRFQGTVPLKVHFGEKGNDTYVPPACYRDVIAYVQEQGASSAYIETNVLYRGARTTEASHRQVALEHGFTDLPIIIADGDHGEAYVEVPIHKTFIDSCKIGAAFEDYDQYVVMSHFKGHGSAGFGGALKQLAMGFAARGGKLAQHSGISPGVNADKCVACGLCIQKCDVHAIVFDGEGKAHIHGNVCVGCAGCIAVCPVGAISNDWSGVQFKEKLTEYAYGAQLGKDNVYISFLVNITKECDCVGKHMEAVAADIGVFASKDPVAIDTACIDMLQTSAGEALFEGGRESLVHALEIGFGTDQYTLIEV